MQNINNCSNYYEEVLKQKQSKEKRQRNKEYNKLKCNVYGVTTIILILTVLLVSVIFIASLLFIKNKLLHIEISQQVENYQRAVQYYQSLNEQTADNAVNDFINELINNVLSIEPKTLTKSNLKSFITETESYIQNFEVLGLSSTHPDTHTKLLEKLNLAIYSLENETYMYPYSDKDYILMCNLVNREQGSNVSSNESQCLVAWVALNRKKNGPLYAKDAVDPNNPTLLEVITQKNQYGPNYSYNMNLDGITDKVKENVRKVFEGEFTAPENVMFQTMKYYENKTLYKKIWNPEPFNSWTYFYYGKTVN